MPPKLKTSFVLSKDALDLLGALADRMGLTKNASLEVLIRDRAKKERIRVPETPALRP